jgi:hypothetical protein
MMDETQSEGSPMSDKKLAELMKRDRKLQAIMGQRELTQAEKDDWENLVREITQVQDEIQNASQSFE